MDDLEAYKRSRELTIPGLEEKLPGKMITDMKALKEFIEDPEKYRVRTGSLFNELKDNKASEKLLASLKGTK